MLETDIKELENRLASLVAREIADLRAELRERIELLFDEQRVCFKQLALEIGEAASAATETSIKTQTQLDELTKRIEELRRLQATMPDARRATAGDQ
jgi:hypothetical protein